MSSSDSAVIPNGVFSNELIGIFASRHSRLLFLSNHTRSSDFPGGALSRSKLLTERQIKQIVNSAKQRVSA